MFKMELDPTFDANVVIKQPGGKTATVRATFRFLEEEAYLAAVKETATQPTAAFVGRLVADWHTEDAPDGSYQGMPLPYSQAALDELMKHQPRAMRAFIDTFHAEALGVGAKN